MRPLRIEEIVPLDRYGSLRDAYRQRVIAYKRSRRVALGERATLLFEDRETLRFQVQEMLWVERIREPDKVQAELDVYNELMPAAGELSATLFLEILESSEIRPTLERLVGLDRHVQLVLGEGAPTEVEGVTVGEAKGRRFVSKTIEILRYLAATRRLPLPH